MNEKIKNTIMCILFVCFIGGFFIGSILLQDAEVSYTERRTLKKMPTLTVENLLSGKYFADFEGYASDQFPLRDSLRTMKAYSHFNVFGMKDNNGIFIIDGNASKLLYSLNERSVIAAAAKFNSLHDTYLQGMRVFYSVVPDKNYYLAEQNGYPTIDYNRLVSILNDNTFNMEYINLFDCIDADGFYKTDPHWRQEKLEAIVARLAEHMEFYFLPISEYHQTTLYPFHGAYYRQSALPLTPDNLIYLTNSTINSVVVTSFSTNDKKALIYETKLFGGMDSYDIFLGGAVPITVIENPTSRSDKELIIFRDSSGSSLAPLLLEGYSKITLIDLRYISSSLLERYIEFTDQDVLFLYNVLVFNNSMMLK